MSLQGGSVIYAQYPKKLGFHIKKKKEKKRGMRCAYPNNHTQMYRKMKDTSFEPHLKITLHMCPTMVSRPTPIQQPSRMH